MTPYTKKNKMTKKTHKLPLPIPHNDFGVIEKKFDNGATHWQLGARKLCFESASEMADYLRLMASQIEAFADDRTAKYWRDNTNPPAKTS
jgi:hypothetical protein